MGERRDRDRLRWQIIDDLWSGGMTGPGTAVEWLAPGSLEQASALRAERGAEATVLAGEAFSASS